MFEDSEEEGSKSNDALRVKSFINKKCSGVGYIPHMPQFNTSEIPVKDGRDALLAIFSVCRW